jgi:predicted DNA-binding ribbon-helix-helix protein
MFISRLSPFGPVGANLRSMLRKRSITLSGHATSVALEPEFWTVLDAVAVAAGLSQAGLMKRIDERRGRTPLASACRLLALSWAEGDRSFVERDSAD